MKEIPLTQGKVALVDDEDFELVNQFKYFTFDSRGKNYAKTRYKEPNGPWRSFLMHRLILNPPSGAQVDHIDGDGLNNQRGNLRLCSVAENSRNRKPMYASSRYKGVSWSKEKKKWSAHICVDGLHINLGAYVKEEDAAMVYDQAAHKSFGEFAYLNFPDALREVE